METRRSSIRMRFIISFFVLMIITFCIVFYFVFTSWKTSADKIIIKMENDLSKDILNKIETFINAPLYINEINHNLIEKEIVNINDKNEREVFFAGVMKSNNTEVYSFSYGTHNGEYYGARRNVKNEIEIMQSDADTNGNSRYYSLTKDLTAGAFVGDFGKFDPRTRDWYKIAVEKGKPIFSPIYKHFVMNDLAITASCPIYSKEGALKGVLGTHLTLSKINNYLSEVIKDDNAIAYIFEKASDELVANSLEMPNFITVGDTKLNRIPIEDINNEYIKEAYLSYKKNQENNLIIKTENDRLHIKITDFKKDGLDWLIITALPESQFTIEIIKNIYISLLLSIIALFVSIIIFVKSTEIVLKPIYDLINVTESFSKGDFSQRAEVLRNDETGRLSNAFNRMAQQLYSLINKLEERVKERTTELEKTNLALEESEGNMRLLLDSTAEAIYGIDMDGNCTFCNASCLRILGYEKQDELIGKNMHWQIHHTYSDGTPFPLEECQIFKAFIIGEGAHVDDEVLWRADGTCFPAEYFSYPQYRDGKIVGAVVTFMDITRRKKSEEEIVYLSYHDPLTGLYNRRYLEEELKRLDVQRNLPLTIIMADMNMLKLINDSLGHAVGDEFLKKAAEVMVKGCRGDDIVTRFGGDEFVILLPKTEVDEAEQIISRIKDIALNEKVNSVELSIAFGFGTKSNVDEKIQEVFKKAEDHMYEQKRSESPSRRS